MKRKFILPILLLSLLCGCTPIDYGEGAVTDNTTATGTTAADTSAAPIVTTAAKDTFEETQPVSYEIVAADFTEQIQIEDFNDHTPWKGLDGYTGNGYVALNAHAYSTLTVNVPTSQFYRIGICVCAEDAAVTVITGGKNEIDSENGEYSTVDGVIQGCIYAEGVLSFKEFFLEGIYLKKGENTITFQTLKGSAYIDYVVVEKGETSAANRFNTSNSTRNKNATRRTLGVMDYLSDIFGKKSLTGQYCTPDTNTELYAVFSAAGRYPAIRCTDLMKYSPSYDGEDKKDNCDIELAADWTKQGGLLSFSWSWYSPSETSHYYADKSDFSLDKAVTETELTALSPDEIKELYEGGFIEKETYAIYSDLDAMAETLKPLAECDAVILWRPLAEAGCGWYWWGNCKNESYIWLWKAMYERFTEYHKLNNLIWVWNGESYELYPGDEYVDIVGEDIYNNTGATNNNRFIKTLAYGTTAKMAALTECGTLPSPDEQFRDNALWLWFSLWRGDYIVNDNGTLNEKYNTAKEIKSVYNHELTITLDELPDFNTYGVQ